MSNNDDLGLSFLGAIAEEHVPGVESLGMPAKLERFLRDGIQPDDDPMAVATCALELAVFWQGKWAEELLRRNTADAELDRLKRKPRRGRPRNDLDLSELDSPAEPKRTGRKRKWIDEMNRKLLAITEQAREQLLKANPHRRVTDLGALTVAIKKLDADAGETISDHRARNAAKKWQPRLSEAKKKFRKSQEK